MLNGWHVVVANYKNWKGPKRPKEVNMDYYGETLKNSMNGLTERNVNPPEPKGNEYKWFQEGLEEAVRMPERIIPIIIDTIQDGGDKAINACLYQMLQDLIEREPKPGDENNPILEMASRLGLEFR